MALLSHLFGQPHHHQPTLPCCPPLDARPSRNSVTRTFRHVLQVGDDGHKLPAPVEVLVRTRLERISGAYVLGDLMYSLSLFPGEDVRVFTTDRRARFTVDQETNITYRAESSFEDHMYLSAAADFFGQISANEWGSAQAGSTGSFKAHGEGSGIFDSLFSGPSGDMNGSFSTDSFADFIGGMSGMASASHHQSVTATSAASAVSVGAIGEREHVDVKLDSHMEMNARHFRNPSATHAVTFYFYQICRQHQVRFIVDSIEVPAVDRLIYREMLPPAPAVGVMKSKPAKKGKAAAADQVSPQMDHLDVKKLAQHRAARAAVVESLKARHLLIEVNGRLELHDAVREQTRFEEDFTLPTPGYIVKGCRDCCEVADPSLFRDVWQLGGMVADSLEVAASAVVDRIVGGTLLPSIVGGVELVQGLIGSATAVTP